MDEETNEETVQEWAKVTIFGTSFFLPIEPEPEKPLANTENQHTI